MAAKHGTRRRYVEGCRCDDCTQANRVYKRNYRERRVSGEVSRPAAAVTVSQAERPSGPGPVEAGVRAELDSLNVINRPGLAATAVASAKLLDNPRAINHAPAAARVLATLLDRLHSASARGHRGALALVRAMTSGDDTTGA